MRKQTQLGSNSCRLPILYCFNGMSLWAIKNVSYIMLNIMNCLSYNPAAVLASIYLRV